ncbi:hypothetical protein PES01_39150 [Pseudoalteromonas espejiana]|uniref:Uncharacterized protein n=1 Tax=Pseudoalteromonas espejiana TaxID=28107 RepID=A0A510Y195_9GAMM|nr:hypothetical protein PES01_39150 [Pseudoalteromonas espejiana]
MFISTLLSAFSIKVKIKITPTFANTAINASSMYTSLVRAYCHLLLLLFYVVPNSNPKLNTIKQLLNS